MKLLPLLALLMVGCTSTVVDTGYTQPPQGAVDYCKRHPEAKVCGN